jgi:hypothetical protein
MGFDGLEKSSPKSSPIFQGGCGRLDLSQNQSSPKSSPTVEKGDKRIARIDAQYEVDFVIGRQWALQPCQRADVGSIPIARWVLSKTFEIIR